VRICLIYDCLFPWTVGGAERWMRNVAEALVSDGHEVTYLTRLQWAVDDPPVIPGVRVIAVSRNAPLYGPDGNRTIGEPLRFGRGVLTHLLRHGRDYDVVHTASFPYFSLLAAGAARRRGRYRIVVDWHEVWSDEYWTRYLGPVKGRVAKRVQGACLRVPQDAFCFAEMTARRLRELGLRGDITVLRGEYDGPLDPPAPQPPEPLVVFAGRMIPEKQAPAVVAAVVAARREVPELRAVIFGDGPQLPDVRSAISRENASSFVEAPGFVDSERVETTMARACCLLLPTIREGYGAVTVEAAAMGVPSVLVSAPDNAAVEHIVDGVNGEVCADASPETLAAAVVRCWQNRDALRKSTQGWYLQHAEELSVENSVREVAVSYRSAADRL
jgi:glycosyltransferase involved in cell wall biosynthesis